jgi:hypothetical protein
MRAILLLVKLALLGPAVLGAEHDIVIYGGTSGGITAAIQARKMGRSVVLIESSPWIGGLTTGGLGATDIGNKQAIGGLSREFYHRVWKHYQQPDAWKQETAEQYAQTRGKRHQAGETTQWTFEPHVAMKVYQAWLAELQIPVLTRQRLDLKQGVKKEGGRIVSITMQSGKTYTGKMFIDATYEGDLMAAAGVRYHVGREANSVYDETINGIQTTHAFSHQFIKKVDPYVTPGDKSSGLLHGIDPRGPGVEFAGDHRVQAYNFRMCTTDVPENRVDWPKPAGYDPAKYELLLRNFEAGDLRVPWNPVWMPNRKTDTNNNFAVSTDYIGQNWKYPDGDYALREQIWHEHVEYQQGLMWTLAHSPRVPAEVQKHFKTLGLARDEFVDNGHWPYALYVREARRMISDYVMTEHNCRRKIVADDSVGMGAYNMDSHNCQRYVTPEGFVRNEGDVQVRVRPYPISFRSIRPRKTEAQNLLVPVCLSASHIAYGSIRMEPVFMVLGQSAATAASLAIESGRAVQDVDYAALKSRLLADGQVLDFDSPPIEDSKRVAIPADKLQGIVVDDLDAQKHGFDGSGTISPVVVSGYAHDQNEGKGDQWIKYTPNLPAAGRYEVRLAYCPNSNRASNVPVTIRGADGEKTVVVNQKHKPPIDGAFISLGVFRFESGRAGSVTITNAGTNGYVVADAVQFIAVK